MECYINGLATDKTPGAEIKTLIPDAALRRRMSRVVKMGVAAAMECVGGTAQAAQVDAIITATGLGCLADSERFLRSVIENGEELLTPTPFIQSTFNTVGAQVALLCRNHGYNTTYVHGSRSFECALLDAGMQIAEGAAHNLLVGAFDEQTPAQHRIMERMGAWRHAQDGEGAVFLLLGDRPSEKSLARIVRTEFLDEPLSREECMRRFAPHGGAVLLWNDYEVCGTFHSAPAAAIAEGVGHIRRGAPQAVVYNSYFGAEPTVTVLRCI